MSTTFGRRDRLMLAVNASAVTVAVAFNAIVAIMTAAYLAPAANGTWQNPGPWVDWMTYAAAFDRLVHGAGIYAPAQLGGAYMLTHVVLVGYAYPPASVPFLAPFADYPWGFVAFQVVNLGLFFTALWALVTRAVPRYRALTMALVLLLLPFFWPFEDGVISANVDLAIAGMIGWVAVGVSPAWLGVFGAAGALTKVFPSVMAAASSDRKLRSIVIGSALTLVACLVTVPIVGLHSWPDFVHALAVNVPDCYSLNWSIACTLGPRIGTTPATLVGLAVAALAALGLLLVHDRFAMALLASVAVMAPVTNLHPHYWTVVPVLGIATLARLREERQRHRWARAPVLR